MKIVRAAGRLARPLLVGGVLIVAFMAVAVFQHAAPSLTISLKVAVAAGLTALLIGLYLRDHQRARARRATLFADCLALFDAYKVVQSDVDYPVLQGRYRGFDVRLDPVLDDIACRKLPSLWLKATLIAPTPYGGALDLLARPRGVEFYSPSEDLAHRVAMPKGWPADASLRTNDPQTMPPLDIVGLHIGVFDDPQTKELVITPHGVRLVRQIWQAERAHYLVLRQSVFAEDRVAANVVQPMLERLIELCGSLAAEQLRRAS
jgi:hypothetical protein